MAKNIDSGKTPNYYKNCILCGDVDYHCILCSETYYLLEDVNRHIKWEDHRKLMIQLSYYKKLEKDGIRHINRLFYCEVCNITAPDLAAIQNHIKEENHVARLDMPRSNEPDKRAVPCKRDSEFIIVGYDKNSIIVNEQDWNAVQDKHCFICDVGVPYDHLHITSADHVRNLIQTTIEESEGRYYRKINLDRFYCFVCKSSGLIKDIESHWKDKKHVSAKQLDIHKASRGFASEKMRRAEKNKKQMALLLCMYDINRTKVTATCKECRKELKINFTEMREHQRAIHSLMLEGDTQPIPCDNTDVSSDEEVVYQELIDHGKKRAELKRYGKKFNIKLNEGGRKGYCYTCHMLMSAHKRVFKQHIKGAHHRGHLEFKGLRPETNREQVVYKTETLEKYLKSVVHLLRFQIAMVNTRFCLDNRSFLMVSPIRNVARPREYYCHACSLQFNIEGIEKHVTSPEHKANFLDADVVTTFNEDFIREIAPNIFHCGLCNISIPYFDNIRRHFRNWVHRDNKASRNITSDISQKCLRESHLSILSSNVHVMYLQMVEQMLSYRVSTDKIRKEPL